MDVAQGTAVPLFWSQPGYSLKPAPVLASERTHAQHLDVIRRHFQKLVGQYGPNVSRALHLHLLLLMFAVGCNQLGGTARQGGRCYYWLPGIHGRAQLG